LPPGSEIEIAMEAHKMLEANGHTTRVVSVPSFELFEEQSMPSIKRPLSGIPVKIAIEAASAGMGPFSSVPTALFIGMTGFGASGTLQGTLRAFRHHRRSSRRGRGRSWPLT
jgi:transketolase